MCVRRLRSGRWAEKHVIVVYREVSGIDGFVTTAYLAGRWKEGRRIVWPK